MVLKPARCFVVLTIANLLLAAPGVYAAAARPLTPAELVQVAKSNPDPEVRQSAINRLGDVTEAEERNLAVTEVLLDLIKMLPDPFVGKAAVRALTRLQSNVSKRPKTKYIKDFTIIIKDKSALPGVRSEIAQCFASTLDKDELNDREAFKSLRSISMDKTEQNISLRGKCIEAMGTFGDPDAIGMLCDLLSDPDSYIKEAAALAISSLLDKAPSSGTSVSLGAMNKIVEMVNDDKLTVDLRVIVILADAKLMAIGTPGANKGLETIIKLASNSPEDKIVLASIQALGIIGTAQAADPLIKTYGDFFNQQNPTNEKDIPVRKAVAKALRSVLTTQALKAQAELQVVHKVAVLLVSIVDNDPVVTVKESAIYGIGYLYPKKFAADQKDAAFALVFLLKKRDTDTSLKVIIPDSLEAITRVNYGQDGTRWEDYLNRTYPAPRTAP